jgi:signal transduction histidine kinase
MRAANEISHEPGDGRHRLIPHDAGDVREQLARLGQEKAALGRANRELEQRVRDLEAQQRSLEDFSAMAAHELLKPLILSETTATSILERSYSRLDLVSQDDLQRMIRASARVRLLVEGLLAEGRQNGGALKRERVDMALVVQHCLELLDPEIRAKRARVVVEPMPVVSGNKALLNGALGNLLVNALKYGPRDNGEIRIGAHQKAVNWIFEVDSPGRPIPSPERSAIFDTWRRGQGERRAKGAGLGLAIVRRIVERHGGEVGVLPLDGRGNRFYFTLPV